MFLLTEMLYLFIFFLVTLVTAICLVMVTTVDATDSDDGHDFLGLQECCGTYWLPVSVHVLS